MVKTRQRVLLDTSGVVKLVAKGQALGKPIGVVNLKRLFPMLEIPGDYEIYDFKTNGTKYVFKLSNQPESDSIFETIKCHKLIVVNKSGFIVLDSKSEFLVMDDCSIMVRNIRQAKRLSIKIDKNLVVTVGK